MSHYQTALNWLDQLASEAQFFRNKQAPSLEITQALLSACGRPDHTFRYRVIIGGTAGKGTVARTLEATLLEQGLSVGLLTSPHLQVVNERIRINGVLVSREVFAEAILRLKDIIAIYDLSPTYYEVLVVAGVLIAAEAGAEVLIGEIGLGGELDAVNAIEGPRIAALTFIGEDHLEMFDHDIEKLAAAKAGIFTADSVLNLTYEQKYSSILKSVSSSEIHYLKGVKQKLNKKLARKICEKILDEETFKMSPPAIPARWESVGDNLILDGAHSGPRFEYILPKVRKYKFDTAILAISPNHAPQGFKTILDAFKNIIWTEFPGSQSAQSLQKLHKVGVVESDLDRALALADGKTLVTGSLYLCGHVRERFYKSEAILDQQTEWPT